MAILLNLTIINEIKEDFIKKLDSLRDMSHKRVRSLNAKKVLKNI